MPDYKTIAYSLDKHVARIALNRPDQRNAVNAEMRDELLQVLAEAQMDPEIRALILTGNGKGFCTGADLSGPRREGPSRPGVTRLVMKASSQRLIRALWELEKPVVAAVNGVAAGLGAHLAFASDFVVAATGARFIEIFVRRGIAIDAGGAFLLPRLVGLQKAKELVFLGDDLAAEDAVAVGLATKVVPADQLDTAALELATRLATGPTLAIGLSKRLLNRSLESSIDTAFEEEALAQTLVIQSEDTREGMLAFMEKRAPQFRGR